jgi:ribosome-binding protein aMBF1 (putative translation factor)
VKNKKSKKWFRAEELHRKWMEDPEYRRAYEALEPEFTIARAIIEARIKRKISQAELAKKMGTGQAVVSRLEGANASPSLSLIKRLADALNLKVELRLTPK